MSAAARTVGGAAPRDSELYCAEDHVRVARGQHAATFRAAFAALVGQRRLFEEV